MLAPQGGTMVLRAIVALLCSGFLIFATAAVAIQGDPLPGIDVSMEQHPTGIIIAQTTSNNAGQFKIESPSRGSFRVLVKFPDKPLTLKTNAAAVDLTVKSMGEPDQVFRLFARWTSNTTVGIEFTTTAPFSVVGQIKEEKPENAPLGVVTAPTCLWAGAAYSLGAAFCIGPDTAVECLKPSEWVAKKYAPCGKATPIGSR
jgi:hypothetical protein